MNLQTKLANAKNRKVQQCRDRITAFAVALDDLPPLPEHCPPRNDTRRGLELWDSQTRHEYDVYQTALRTHENAKRDLVQARELLHGLEIMGDEK